MGEHWGNGHYSCGGCAEAKKPLKERTMCATCFTYTPLMQPYYRNWIPEKEKVIMTNADRIRAMTDEELAEWLHNICQFDKDEEPMVSIYDLDKKKDIEMHDSYGDLLEWLQSPVEV